jgi:hypothetical protein
LFAAVNRRGDAVNTVVNPDRQVSTSELLDAVPMRNRTVRAEKDDEQELVLAVPMRRRWYMKRPFSWLFPFSTHRRVALDAMGREVWNQCDGDTAAEKIIEEFAGKHQLTFHEARISVMLFLKDLTQRGMIVMIGAPSRGAAR